MSGFDHDRRPQAPHHPQSFAEYFQAKDFTTLGRILTLIDCTKRWIRSKRTGLEELLPVAWFAEDKRGWILRDQNREVMKELYGDDHRLWIGEPIHLCRGKVPRPDYEGGGWIDAIVASRPRLERPSIPMGPATEIEPPVAQEQTELPLKPQETANGDPEDKSGFYFRRSHWVRRRGNRSGPSR